MQNPGRNPSLWLQLLYPKVVVLWLFVHCLLLLPTFVGFFAFGPCLCNAVLNVLSSFSLRKRAMVALL